MHDDLTAQDIAMMQKELDHRKLELMPELIEEVKRTRAFGDLSENFEYKAAKQAQNRNRSRIRYLERMIKTAQIVEDDAGEEELGLNDTVVVYVPEDDCEEVYKIVTTIRADVMNNMISIESPMGKCLLKHRVGDTVTIELENGVKYDVIIREIRKSDDESEEISRY